MGQLAGTRTAGGEKSEKNLAISLNTDGKFMGCATQRLPNFKWTTLTAILSGVGDTNIILPFYPLFVVMRPVRLFAIVWWLQFDAVAGIKRPRKPFLKHHHHHHHSRKHWIFPPFFFLLFLAFSPSTFFVTFGCCCNNTHTGCSPLGEICEIGLSWFSVKSYDFFRFSNGRSTELLMIKREWHMFLHLHTVLWRPSSSSSMWSPQKWKPNL